MTRRPRLVAGCMTGTSIDGIDLALARIEGRGLEMRATLLRQHSRPLGALGERLRAAAEQRPLPAREFASMALELGVLHADAVAELAADDRLDLVVAHGQTVFHAPPVSWQLLNPAPIAARLRCRVLCDLRQSDLAAGGQGAPITPLADWILFRHPTRRRAIVNLGGFCNATILPEDTHGCLHEVRGGDLCACNQILDAVARRALGMAFDGEGAEASQGRPDEIAVDQLRLLLAVQDADGAMRSLGTGDEAGDWIETWAPKLAPRDLAASAAEAIGATIGAWLRLEAVDEALLAGGGTRHHPLVEAIGARTGAQVATTAKVGVPIDAREALSMAVLGALAEDGVEITLAAVTGRKALAGRSGLVAG